MILDQIMDNFAHNEGEAYSLYIFIVLTFEILAYFECIYGAMNGFALVFGLFGRKQLNQQKPWYFGICAGAVVVIGCLAYIVSIIAYIMVIFGICFDFNDGFRFILPFCFRIILPFAFSLIADYLFFTFFNKLNLSVPKRLASALIIAVFTAPYILFLTPLNPYCPLI